MVRSRSLFYALLGLLVLSGTGASWLLALQAQTPSYSQEEAGSIETGPGLALPFFADPYANWTRPDGPVRVGIQVGHWQVADAPEEFERLRENTGASAAGVTEWETNLVVAKKLQGLLEVKGIAVDLLPVTIPPDYLADAFISLHSDGDMDTAVSGFKIAAPWRDRTGKAEELSKTLETVYAEATKLPIDPNVTQNMRGYYAFNWRKYEHSIHPMTPAAIVETGFLTNPSDRRTIVAKPDLVAQAIADGIERFLASSLPGKFPVKADGIEKQT